jgi:predicted nucleic acid-binding protein
VTAAERVVVDANLVVALFAQEVFTPHADALADSGVVMVAPDFIGVEAANAFLKKVRRGEMRATDATQALRGLPKRLVLISSESLWEPAFEFARTHKLTAYDALYAVLARTESIQLVTADTEIADVLRAHFPAMLLWLGDVPTQ